MADTRIQPNFRAFAPLQSEPAKGSLDPERKAEPARKDGAAPQRKTLSISQYQDPRDELDQQRHELRQAKINGEGEGKSWSQAGEQ